MFTVSNEIKQSSEGCLGCITLLCILVGLGTLSSLGAQTIISQLLGLKPQVEEIALTGILAYILSTLAIVFYGIKNSTDDPTGAISIQNNIA
jgi:hypothetical protein